MKSDRLIELWGYGSRIKKGSCVTSRAMYRRLRRISRQEGKRQCNALDT